MKKFKTTNGQTVRLVLMDGHITLVGPEWKNLNERFWTAAYSQGCISEDMIKNTATSDIDPRVVNTLNNIALQKNEVEDAIKNLIRENRLEAFDSKGKPKSTVLTEMVGFRVTNPIRDEVWARVQESNDEAS